MEKQLTISENIELSFKESPIYFAKCLLAFGVFLLPFGISFSNIILLVAGGFTVLSGRWEEKWNLLSHHKTTQWILLFGFLLFLGVFYSGGTSQHAWEGLAKYDKILYFLVFLPLATNVHFRRVVINLLIIGTVFSVILGSQANPIDSSFIVGFTTFILLRRILEGGKWRWLNGLLFIFLSAYLLFYNIERTGYLIFFGGLATIFWQLFRWRGMAIGLTLIVSLMASLYWVSPVFQSRVQLGISESISYLSEDANQARSVGKRLGFIPLDYTGIYEEQNFSLYDAYKAGAGFSAQKEWLFNPHAPIHKSSIGLRLGFMRYSWQEIKKHPWIGNGTGSFKDVYEAGGGPKIDVAPLGHPHNEYVLIGFQWGVVGLIIFLIWQMTLWQESFYLPKKEQAILQGLVVCFALLGMCNVSLYVNPPGDVFIILTALLLASKNCCRGKKCELQ